MIFDAGSSPRQMFWGDILLAGCCAFYLLWWILAFKPADPVKGMKSGWLLIPAFILGLAAGIMIIRGANSAELSGSFFSGRVLLASGIAAYIVLLLVTGLALHRQVTTELILIVGWTVLAFYEINAVYGLGIIARGAAVALFIAAVITAALSMICYMLYYGLESRTGYFDGMVPLILIAAFMAVMAVLTFRN